MSGSDSDYASDHSDVKGHCRCIVKHEALHADELSLDIGGTVKRLVLDPRSSRLELLFQIQYLNYFVDA